MSPTRRKRRSLSTWRMGTICGRFGMNREVRDIFEIQAEIARTIAERLKVTLRGWGGDH